MANVPANIFRGYDIRGLVGKELNPDVVYQIGQAYATFLYRRQIRECVIGQDCRETSEEYKKSFIKALLEAGFQVTDFGLSLTQTMYFAQYRYLSKGGALITASHNAVEFNGMKMAVGFSETLTTVEMVELKEIALSGEFKKWDTPGKLTEVDVFPDYKKDLFEKIPLHDSGLKVVIDSSNATTGVFLPDILREAGCEVVEQNTKLDPTFPLGTPDPTEKHVLERLAKKVKEEKADLGVTYDSDGDRLGIVDEEGNLIWNDVLVAMFAEDILNFLPGSPIIFNTLCSKAVIDVIKRSGGKPIMWLTGHSFIKVKVAEERAPFGGELSGHFYFTDNYYGHDDGAVATLRLLQYLKRKGKSLKACVDEIPKYVGSPEIKLGIPDDIKFKFVAEKLAADVKDILPNAEYVDIDGMRADTDDEMIIMRGSQNGPYFTIKFEGRSQEQYDSLKKQIKEHLDKHPEIIWDEGVNIDAFD